MDDRFKFRVWHKEKEHMYRNVAIGVGKDKVGYKLGNIKGRYVWEETDDFIVNQSTGHKDMKGKWIFEHDIVKFGNKKSYLAIAVWDGYKFVFEDPESGDQEDKFAHWGKIKHVKIMGNIYEDKELTEEEEED